MSQFEREDRTMGIIEKAQRKKFAGFSLLELMVVVAILGVLAMVAIPRYDIFRTRARQSEAKSNLGVIYSLQESFRIENEKYYDGSAGKWSGAAMDSFGASVGYRGGATAGTSKRVCNSAHKNKLGFRLANCDSARYAYFFAGGREKDFIAIAHGTSDAGVGDERIYPGCGGGTVTTWLGGRSATELAASVCVNTASVTIPSDHPTGGDSWCLDENRNVENYRDIVENCP